MIRVLGRSVCAWMSHRATVIATLSKTHASMKKPEKDGEILDALIQTLSL